MNGTPAWLLANGFTKKSIDGLGSVKGAPCTINSIVDNGDGTHTVIFSWTSNSGVTQTSNLIVKDGKNGVDGTNGVDAIQIASITATEDNKILVTMEDGTEHETAVIPTVKGEDGKSAEITVERVANGVKITGKDEEHGETVATAQDGISPSVSVARNAANDGVVVTVTDKSGTTTQNVYDGSAAATVAYGTQVTGKPSINGVELVGNKTSAELGINIPTKNSQLTNDSGFITASDIPSVDAALSQVSENAVQNKIVTTEIRQTQETVNNLVSEVGANTAAIDILNGAATVDGSVKKQIADAIANMDKLTKKIVDAIPDADSAEDNIIYMIENPDGDGYLQYTLVTNDVGAKVMAPLGGTNVDLTEYYTQTETDALLAEKQASITGAASTITTMNMTANRALVSNANGKVGVSAVKATELEMLSGVTGNIQSQLDGKQDTLTIDDAISSTSENPVQNKAVSAALTLKQGTLTFENTVVEGSSNPVTSNGIATALAAKQDTLTIDASPRDGYTDSVVSSGGVYSAIQDAIEAAKEYTDEAVATTGGFKVVPSIESITEPDTHLIYLIEDSTATGEDKFKEYIYEYDEVTETGKFKCIGETSLDLSDYIKNTNYATDTAVGVVKVDGSTITADADGTIHGANTLKQGVGITIKNNVISANTNTFIGTKAEWEALSDDEKKEYSVCNLTDDEAGTNNIVDAVESGNMNPVTSNAVASVTNTLLKGKKTTYAGSQSVDIRLGNSIAIIYSSEYANSAALYVLLSNYNSGPVLLNLGQYNGNFSCTVTHKSDRVETITVTTGNEYSWSIITI